jgi:predicted nucleotidyltransferase component of viral defense system
VLTRHVITRRASDDEVDATVVERDYVLAHIVAQLHRLPERQEGQLVFKGGTALRMVHFDGYRYSADLDFTALGISADEATAAVSVALDAAREHAGLPHLELSTDGKPTIEYVGPLESAKPRKLKLDIANDEYVETVSRGSILPAWEDLPDPIPFAVYPVEEIGAEKLRCIIQRVQCRDLYDLYRLTGDLGLSLAEIRPLLESKARAKDLAPEIFPERFDDRIERFERLWDDEMTVHVAAPPRFDDVVRSVRRELRAAHMI